MWMPTRSGTDTLWPKDCDNSKIEDVDSGRWHPQSAITTASSATDLTANTEWTAHAPTSPWDIDPFDCAKDDDDLIELTHTEAASSPYTAEQEHSTPVEPVHPSQNEPYTGYAEPLEETESSGNALRPVSLIDWDDTIFPSTWLHSLDRELNDLSDAEHEILRNVEDSALEFVKIATQRTRVFIVTNAESGWVQLSAFHFMPRLYEFISRSHLPIISARQFYAAQLPKLDLKDPSSLGGMSPFMYSNNIWPEAHVCGRESNNLLSEPDQWKRATFMTLISQLISERDRKSQKLRKSAAASASSRSSNFDLMWESEMFCERKLNLLSVGDSECERRALMKCREHYHRDAHFKSVKFLEGPSPSLLRRQHLFLIGSLQSILDVDDCLDLVFEPPSILPPKNKRHGSQPICPHRLFSTKTQPIARPYQFYTQHRPPRSTPQILVTNPFNLE